MPQLRTPPNYRWGDSSAKADAQRKHLKTEGRKSVCVREKEGGMSIETDTKPFSIIENNN